MRSWGESVDAAPLWGSCESDMSVGSAHGTDESAKRVLDMACGTATIAVEGHAVVLTAAKWEIPDVWCPRNLSRNRQETRKCHSALFPIRDRSRF